MDVFVFFLDLANNLIPIPEDLETELELVLHLVQHVAERLVGRAQQLHDVIVGLEDRAKGHRDDGVVLHDRLVDPLMGEDVVAGRILDDQRGT